MPEAAQGLVVRYQGKAQKNPPPESLIERQEDPVARDVESLCFSKEEKHKLKVESYLWAACFPAHDKRTRCSCILLLISDAASAREAEKASRFRFLCYLHFLQQLAPPPHLGADGRRYIRSLVRRGATYAPFYVYDQVSPFLCPLMVTGVYSRWNPSAVLIC